jgi:hypothetical protein
VDTGRVNAGLVGVRLVFLAFTCLLHRTGQATPQRREQGRGAETHPSDGARTHRLDAI